MARLHRRLRHLRRLLVLLATGTTLCAVAATRLESTGRGVAAAAAAIGVLAWLVVLETEGRVADRLERMAPRRRGIARVRAPQRMPARRITNRRAA